MFMAVGAFCSQLAATRRQAVAMTAAIFGAAYLIRLIAYADMKLMWLRWASPLEWADELQPLTGSCPLLLLPIVGLTVVMAAAAVILAGRRDLGASMLPASDTAAPRTRLLTGPFGLACRLARRGALGWLAGLAGGLILGLTAKGTETVFSSQSGGVIARLGGTTAARPTSASPFSSSRW
jgi:ABC-2 type transport system permease protein